MEFNFWGHFLGLSGQEMWRGWSVSKAGKCWGVFGVLCSQFGKFWVFEDSGVVVCRICICCAWSGWVNQLLLPGTSWEWEQMGFTGKN